MRRAPARDRPDDIRSTAHRDQSGRAGATLARVGLQAARIHQDGRLPAPRDDRDAVRYGEIAAPADECEADPPAPDRHGRNSCLMYPAPVDRNWRSPALAWLADAFATLVRSAPAIFDDIDHVSTKLARSRTQPARKNRMAEYYRIIGAEMSPYSVKVRSYFRYKAIPHQWVLRNAESQAEFEKYAKVPIIPLVVTPEGTGIQDSTPIIDEMEKIYPLPSVHPDDLIAKFISILIEEFGDEWGNKWMFHYRWTRDVDQISSAGRIARMRGANLEEHK